MSSILQAEPYVDKCTDVLLMALNDVADTKATIDLLQWARMSVSIRIRMHGTGLILLQVCIRRGRRILFRQNVWIP
jgi:hypothetical protein